MGVPSEPPPGLESKWLESLSGDVAADYNKHHFRQLEIADAPPRRGRAPSGNEDASEVTGTWVATSHDEQGRAMPHDEQGSSDAARRTGVERCRTTNRGSSDAARRSECRSARPGRGLPRYH